MAKAIKIILPEGSADNIITYFAAQYQWSAEIVNPDSTTSPNPESAESFVARKLGEIVMNAVRKYEATLSAAMGEMLSGTSGLSDVVLTAEVEDI